MRTSKTDGLTLIELLIVMVVIGLLIQLVLPSLGASRESARRTQCKNNLKQLALAFQNHESTHGHLPSSGWGRGWLGLPDRGYGAKQPGGWAYNILPFVEQQHVRNLGAGFEAGSEGQREASLTANSTPIPLLNCPSRRPAEPYSFVDQYVARYLPQRCGKDPFPCKVIRGDYAANAGNINHWVHRATGPRSLAQGDGEWKTDWIYGGPVGRTRLTGVSYQRSEVRLAEVTDGTSHTYCLGEKYVPIPYYETGEWFSDNGTLFLGQDYDNNRWSGTNEGEDIPPPALDSHSDTHKVSFGSAHPQGFHMAFCDGSVRVVEYDGDLTIHRLHGGRDDEATQPN